MISARAFKVRCNRRFDCLHRQLLVPHWGETTFLLANNRNRKRFTGIVLLSLVVIYLASKLVSIQPGMHRRY